MLCSFMLYSDIIVMFIKILNLLDKLEKKDKKK